MFLDDSKYPVEVRVPYRKGLAKLTPAEYEDLFRRYYHRVDVYKETHGVWPHKGATRGIINRLVYLFTTGKMGNKKHFRHLFDLSNQAKRMKKWIAEGGTRYEYGMMLRGDPKKRANKGYELRVQEAEIRRAARKRQSPS